VLSNGIVADRENNKRLSKFFKVPLNSDGFFLEAHVKLRPVEFATDGVFLAGLAHSPKGIDESISQAYAAVSRATTVLSKDGIETSGITTRVDELKCVGCGMCVETCPYSALELTEKKVFGTLKTVATVNTVLCKGCGACTAACRSGAIDLAGFTNEEIVSEIFALSEENSLQPTAHSLQPKG
jgi:heterodisulfide reductase subunit A